ncbi:unnamed protein product, partial [marine sediment metagenome]
IENKVLDFFNWYECDSKNYSILVRDFFKYFCDGADEDSKSHLETAYDRSIKACDFEGNGKFDKAAEEWQKIFGDDFPKTQEENKKSNFTSNNSQPKPIINPPRPWLFN